MTSTTRALKRVSGRVFSGFAGYTETDPARPRVTTVRADMIASLQQTMREIEEGAFRSAFGPAPGEIMTATEALQQQPLRSEDVFQKIRRVQQDLVPWRNQISKLICDWAMIAPPPAIRVIVGPEPWPREQKGMETAHLPAHPIIRWLARWLPVTPSVAYQRPRMVETGPYAMQDGTMVMSARQYAELKQATKPC